MLSFTLKSCSLPYLIMKVSILHLSVPKAIRCPCEFHIPTGHFKIHASNLENKNISLINKLRIKNYDKLSHTDFSIYRNGSERETSAFAVRTQYK